MCQLVQRPAEQTLLELYPSLYRIDNIEELPELTPSEGSTESEIARKERRKQRKIRRAEREKKRLEQQKSNASQEQTQNSTSTHSQQPNTDQTNPNNSESETDSTSSSEDEIDWETPHFLPLSAEVIGSAGMFLLDCGDNLILWIGQNVSSESMRSIFGKTFPHELKEYDQELPEINDSLGNVRLREFIEIIRTSYLRGWAR